MKAGRRGLFAEIASQVPVIIVNGRLDVPGSAARRRGISNGVGTGVPAVPGRAAGKSSICMTAKPTAAAGNGAATRRAWGHADWIQKGGFSRQTSMCAWKTRRRRPGRFAVFLEETGRREGTLPDAVLTADDVLAVPAQKVLLSIGRQVPVIGWNNSMYAQMASPALTSVDIRMDRMAEAAADLLRQALEGNRETAFVEIEPVLAVRESFVPEAPADGSA